MPGITERLTVRVSGYTSAGSADRAILNGTCRNMVPGSEGRLRHDTGVGVRSTVSVGYLGGCISRLVLRWLTEDGGLLPGARGVPCTHGGRCLWGAHSVLQLPC